MFAHKTIAALFLFGAAAQSQAADASTDDRIKELQEALAKQQHEIEALPWQTKAQEESNKEATSQYIRTEIDNQQRKQAPILSLGKHISALKISGDLRLRYQHDEAKDDTAFQVPYAQNAQDVADLATLASSTATTAQKNAAKARLNRAHAVQRDRFRQRFRIGFNWESKDEAWEVGARLVTGDDGSGRSTNQTFGAADSTSINAYDHGSVRIDQAYARLKFSNKDDDFYSAATFGQQPNPYKTNWIFQDTDLTPVGVTYQYDWLTSGSGEVKTQDRSAWFNTIGAYTVDHRNRGNERSDIFALQAQSGYRDERFVAALGLTHYTNGATDRNLDGVSNAGDIRAGDYGYDIAELYTEAVLYKEGKDLTEHFVKLTADFAKNLSANDKGGQVSATTPEDISGRGDSVAYFLGLDGQWNQFTAGYAWAHVEQDSLPNFIIDSEFGGGSTGYEGHVFKLGYKFTKNLEIGGTAVLASPIQGDSTSLRDNLNYYQLDASWKF